MAFKFNNSHWLWVSALIILADQVTKQLVVNHVAWAQRIPLTDWLNLTYLRNTGAAFSILSDMPQWAFALLGCAVAVGIIIWLRRHPTGERLVAVSLALILGGAIGNVIDRVTRGFVVDFVDFHIGTWHYPAFNVADVAITLGAACLILDMILAGKRERAAAKAGEGAA